MYRPTSKIPLRSSQSRFQHPHLVPTSHPALLYGLHLDINELLQHLRWMFKKAKLGQDMFLIGPPSPIKRWLAYRFCELTRRECEYLALTRDTTEADLKQRREIRHGSMIYIDQAAVRAAINGRVLILEGIEKCERNVLPVLNNLLENREMHLEDGRFLVSPGRYKHLLSTRSQEELDALRLVAVHPSFQVIALGLPVPRFEGNPLDPPLRSRFQARNITALAPESQLSIIRTLYPNSPSDSVQKLLTFAEAVNRFQFSDELSSIPRLLHYPSTATIEIARILNIHPDTSVYPLLLRIFPFDIKSDEAERAAIKAALQSVGLANNFDLATHQRTDKLTTSAREHILHGKVSLKQISDFNAHHSKQNTTTIEQHDRVPFVETERHQFILESLKLDMEFSFATCLVGEQGCGKTRLITRLAESLKQSIRTVQLYKDMTARDLLQRRSTNSSGDTIWINSPLVDAAIAGDIAVLDGAHRLGPGTLAALQQLIFDREATLCDGTRLVPHDFPSFDNAGRMLRVHPQFRIVALGNPPPRSGTPKGQWLTSEVVSMFHFHNYKDAGWPTKIAIIETLFPQLHANKSRAATPTAEDKALHNVLDFAKQLEDAKKRIITEAEAQSAKRDNVAAGSAAVDDHTTADGQVNDLPCFSLRQLIRTCRRVTRFANDLGDVVENTLLLRFLPIPVREAIAQLTERSPIYQKAPSTSAVKETLRVVVTEEKLIIGDTEWRRNVPRNPALVPRINFVDIPNHVRLLREMAKDFMLGDHILLIGNQGVGKNMLADRLLELLRLEREYIQLHRDTTVQTLTLSPSIEKGVVVWEDSPLVRAVRDGRILVIDEADKAPLEVVCVLKGLIEDGEMLLADGRRIVAQDLLPRIQDLHKVIPIHKDFKMIVLANRPGYPFLGNNFFRECGDCFAVHVVDNPDRDSEMALLRSYGPHVDDEIINRLISLFGDLRAMVDRGLLTYPYSLRELVNIVKHLEAFPSDSLITSIDNVFHFDSYDTQLREHLAGVFHKHGIPLSSTVFVNFKVKLAEEQPLPADVPTSRWSMDPPPQKPGRYAAAPHAEPKPMPCNVREFPFSPKATWPVDRGQSYPIKSKQYGRIHTFTEERLSFNLEVQGRPLSMAGGFDGAVHVLTTSPLQLVTFPSPYNTFSIARLSDHLHTFFMSDPTGLYPNSSAVTGLPNGQAVVFFAVFNMILLVGPETLQPFELTDPDVGNYFAVIDKSIIINRQLRQALQRQEIGRNGLYTLQMRDSLAHKGILVFYRSLGTDFFVVNTGSQRAWHVRTAENIQILDLHVLDENLFLVHSRNETKYFVKGSLEIPNKPRSFDIVPIFTESLSGEQISSLVTLGTHHFVAPQSANPAVLASVQTHVQMASSSFEQLLQSKVPLTIRSFIRTLQRPRKTDTLNSLNLRHSGQGHLLNLVFVPTGEFDAEPVLLGNQSLPAAIGKRSVRPDDDPHFALEVVDTNKRTLRNIKVRTGAKSEKTILETGPTEVYSFQTATANRVHKVVAVCELANGDVACLAEDGRITMIEVSQVALDAQLGKWKNLMGLNDNSNNNPEKPLTVTYAFDGKRDPSAPKVGQFDPKNEPHKGGNTFAGGVGGADTAGMGGSGGPFRMDVGIDVAQVSTEQKAKMSAESMAAARQMAKQALNEKLSAIEMSQFDESRYQVVYNNVKHEIRQLRAVLETVQAKERERTWRKLETTGEIDENRLVDGITGARNVYKKRGEEDPYPGAFQEKPKRMRFAIDISGSLYRFDSSDKRLQRVLDLTMLIMESLRGFEHKYSYSIVGHSGDSPEVLLIDYNKPPKNAKERMQILDKMVAHSQYCSTGDFTVKATELAVKNVTKEEADDYFVFVFSDANLGRYDIRPSQLADALRSDPRVHAYIVFIASLADEATRIKAELPLGKAFVAMDPATLVYTFKQIFMSEAVTGSDD